MFRFGGWYWYSSEKEKLLEKDKCGKWMCFFTDQKFAMDICEKAIAENACYSCKCRDLELTGVKEGVICFYLNCDDKENHHRIIQFMLDNNLIRKTKTGKLYNNSFKLDSQTRTGEYGTEFTGVIRLADFIDLNTGKWVV